MPNERLDHLVEKYKEAHEALMVGGYRISVLLGLMTMLGGASKSDSMVTYGGLAIIMIAGVAGLTEKFMEASKKDKKD